MKRDILARHLTLTQTLPQNLLMSCWILVLKSKASKSYSRWELVSIEIMSLFEKLLETVFLNVINIINFCDEKHLSFLAS